MARKSIEILLIEDDRGYARLISEMTKSVTEVDIVLLHAPLLMEGISILAENKIDVVLLDLTLPDSEGIDTFLRIKGMVPEVPIVVLTGKEDEGLAITAVKYGAQDYIFKTEMRPPLLIRSLRYAVERKQALLALKSAHDLLEQKVKERTADLVRINEQLKLEIEEKRRAEESLSENERLFRATIESTGDGIFVVNENGEVTHKNARFAELWRIPEEILATNSDDRLLAFLHERLEDAPSLLAKAKELTQTTKHSHDILTTKDGKVFERYTNPLTRDGKYAGRVWNFRDVTDHVRAQKKLADSEQRFRGIAERSFDIIYETDQTGAFTYISPAIERLTGWKADELVGKPLSNFITQTDAHVAVHWMDRVLGGMNVEGIQVLWMRKDGNTAVFEINASPIYKERAMIGSMGIARDISERNKMREQLWIASQMDQLTGLYAQRYFFKAVEDEIKRAKRIPYPLSLLLLDVEDFASFNEANGRKRGDELLTRLGAAIRRCVRKDLDIPCRYGGDEFAVILPNAEKPEALVVAGRIRERASRKLGGVELRIGISQLNGGLSPDEFIAEAQKALKLQTVFHEKTAAKIVPIDKARKE
ncbi:MAG: PAS domain S-box protein [Deltaproteobacteria bacterium]|nr:PAS domain S-box protein [Candidatus Zymogenaceae bacterium]